MAGGDTAPVSGAQPRHFLRACVLLLLGEEPVHGYELLERLAEFRLGDDSGTVYRLLRALEHQGRVGSSWQRSDQGPARRCYELTQKGNEELDAWVHALARSRDELAAFVARAAPSGNQLRGRRQGAVAGGRTVRPRSGNRLS